MCVVAGFICGFSFVVSTPRPCVAVPYSGMSVHLLFELLYSVSGQCNWLMVVCCHCVLDVRPSSVIVCWLMAIWMNVGDAVIARWLFFFSGPSPNTCA